jgi:hypothetical protein
VRLLFSGSRAIIAESLEPASSQKGPSTEAMRQLAKLLIGRR